MNGDALRVRVIEGRGSWRTHALNAFLRFASRMPLRQDSDIAALRRRYEVLDARYFQVDPPVMTGSARPSAAVVRGSLMAAWGLSRAGSSGASQVDQRARARERKPNLGCWTGTDVSCDDRRGRKRCRRGRGITGQMMGLGAAGQQYAQP